MKKWLDNYGKKENANEGHSSASKEWIGEGYSNVGRNYSPAWGGQFQLGGNVYPVNYVPEAAMGGSIPGSVGFTYARTNSPAPSNGPYAKKTLPSAQNGKEMSFYQHGLDWKPKSISKNGGWLDKYIPEAQGGLNIPGVTDFKMPLNRTDTPGLSIQEKQKQDAVALEIQRRNEATAKRQFVGKAKASTKESEARRTMLNAQNTAGLPNVQIDQFGNTSRINPNMTYTGEPANFMGERQQKGYEHVMGALDAAGYVTGVGELANLGYGALKKGISESMRSGLLSRFKPIEVNKPTIIENIVDKTKTIPYTKPTVPEAYDYLEAVKIPSRNLEALSHAQEFAQKYGYEFPSNLERISKSQTLTDKTIRGLMNRHNTVARGVGTNWENLKKSLVEQYGDELGNVKYDDLINSIKEKGIDPYSNPQAAAEFMASYTPSTITAGGRADIPPDIINAGNEGLYTVNSLGGAEGYTHGDGYIVKLKRSTDYSSLNRKDWIDKNLWDYHLDDPFNYEPFPEKVIKAAANQPLPVSPEQYIKQIEGNHYNLNYYLSDKPFTKKIEEAEKISEKLLNPKYKSIQEDPVLKKEYYDLIDERSKLYNSAATERSEHINEYVKSKYPNFDLENKYAHYIFLGKPNEKMLEPVHSIKITPEKWRQTSRQHFGEYSRGLTRNKQGGIIKDNRGQWDHPGEITEIQGNTMATHGYGNLPLYVVPDVGEPRVVEANTGTHTFPGATKFTEYPITQKSNKKENGGWLSQYK